MSTLSGISQFINSALLNSGAIPTDTTTQQTTGTGASTTTLPDTQALYLGFQPLSITISNLGLRLPQNAGDSSTLFAEIALLLEKTIDETRKADATTRAGLAAGTLAGILTALGQMDAISQEIATDEASRGQKQSQKNAAEQSRTDKIDQRGSLYGQQNQLVNEINSLNSQISSAPDSQKPALIALRDAKQTQLNAVDNAINTLTNEINALTDQINTLASEITALTNKIDANRVLFFELSNSLLNAFMSLAAATTAETEDKMTTEMDRDDLSELRFDDLFVSNTEIETMLADLARALDIRLDKDREVADLRRVVLPAVLLAIGIAAAVETLKSMTPVNDNVDDAALMQNNRFRLEI